MCDRTLALQGDHTLAVHVHNRRAGHREGLRRTLVVVNVHDLRVDSACNHGEVCTHPARALVVVNVHDLRVDSAHNHGEACTSAA